MAPWSQLRNHRDRGLALWALFLAVLATSFTPAGSPAHEAFKSSISGSRSDAILAPARGKMANRFVQARVSKDESFDDSGGDGHAILGQAEPGFVSPTPLAAVTWALSPSSVPLGGAAAFQPRSPPLL